MEDLTWAVRCANVGIKGGALLLVATVVLFAAGLGADGEGTGAQKRWELRIFAVDETSSRRVTQHLRANSTPKRFHT